MRRVNRRRFLQVSAVVAAAGPAAAFALAKTFDDAPAMSKPAPALRVPPDGTIRTAVTIGDGFNVIDVAGPWEAFQDAAVAGAAGRFELFTVAEARRPYAGSGGLTVEPTHTFASAPRPHVVVIPAHAPGAQTIEWLRAVAPRADLLMSVCTGAFVLAETGLLDGKTATTHHGSWDDFEATFPRVTLVRGPRFVEHEHVATAGGLTSGIDLALRVVERYLDGAAADETARYMEHSRT
jgi:transcriptional regulator GlxA family with amidase domain